MRRWLIVPDLFLHTVVFLYVRESGNDAEPSWSIRDYSSQPVRQCGPRDLGLTLEQVLSKETHIEPAPKRPVGDPAWFTDTGELNQRYAEDLHPEQTPQYLCSPAPATPAQPDPPSFPIVDEVALRAQRRGLALQRMLHSPRSEDWVSWSVFRLMTRMQSWWPTFLAAVDLDLDPADVPTVELWRQVPSPPPYETASRARMAASTNDEYRRRAANPRPVEKPTEVDIVLEGRSFLCYIEAKLGSDLSPATTYDPTRNQLARNIDVLLHTAAGRRPIMLIATANRRANKLYSSLPALYREDLSSLGTLLPHYELEDLRPVVADLRLVTWDELLPVLPQDPPVVVAELRRRLDAHR